MAKHELAALTVDDRDHQDTVLEILCTQIGVDHEVAVLMTMFADPDVQVAPIGDRQLALRFKA